MISHILLVVAVDTIHSLTLVWLETVAFLTKYLVLLNLPTSMKSLGKIVLFTPYAGGSASSTETIKSSKVLKEVLRSSGIYHSRNVPTKPLGFRHKQLLERGVMGYALAIVINTVT